MCEFYKSLNAPVPYHTFYQDIQIKLTLLSSWPIILSDSLLGQLPAWLCIVCQKNMLNYLWFPSNDVKKYKVYIPMVMNLAYKIFTIEK